MKLTKYIIEFLDGDTVEELAFCSSDAFVLAAAKRIRDGKDYRHKSITNTENGEKMICGIKTFAVA